jgi:hypothetical protein
MPNISVHWSKNGVGITDIILESDGVVQGKEEVLRAARAAGISLRSMQEV